MQCQHWQRVTRLLQRRNLRDERSEQAGELPFDTATGFHDFFMVDGFIEDACGHVRHDGQPEDLDAHVASHDDFMHSGHADEIGAEGVEGTDFGGGLITRAEHGKIDTFSERDVLATGFRMCEGAQTGRVSRRHIEEARTEPGLVGAEGGIGSGEIDVIGDGNQRALLITGVDASSSIGDDEGLAAEQTEDADGEGNLGRGVSLIGMSTTLHNNYRNSGDMTKDEFAGMAFNCRLRKMRYIAVTNTNCVIYL